MRRPQFALASAILIALLSACSTGGTPTTIAPTAAVATAAASSAPSTSASSAPSAAPTSSPTAAETTAPTSAAATVAATRPAGVSSPIAPPGGNPVATASRAAATRTSTATASGGVLLRGMIEQGGTLTVAALQGLPSETIQVTFLSGNNTEQHTYTGVRLYTVLNNAKLRVNNDRYKNDKLRKSIVATGVLPHQEILLVP